MMLADYHPRMNSELFFAVPCLSIVLVCILGSLLAWCMRKNRAAKLCLLLAGFFIILSLGVFLLVSVCHMP